MLTTEEINNMNYFSECTTIAAAKKLYHKLMMENHPDKGGDTETAKAINGSFEDFCKRFMNDAFSQYEKENGYTSSANVDAFAEVLETVMQFNCRVEVIGFWIYCFESFEVKDELKEMGFFFSKKHRAWIFNGREKRSIRSKLTTDDIRNLHGAEIIREREERKAIA